MKNVVGEEVAADLAGFAGGQGFEGNKSAVPVEDKPSVGEVIAEVVADVVETASDAAETVAEVVSDVVDAIID